jgi:hypothetical protein
LDIRAPLDEEFNVRKVWGRLNHLSAAALGEEQPGQVEEIFVECDIAEGPYSSEASRQEIAVAYTCDVEVEQFQVARSIIDST